MQDCKTLQRVVRSAEHIKGGYLPPLQDIYRTNARRIIKDPSHPDNGFFSPLRSGRRYWVHKANTERLRKSFLPSCHTDPKWGHCLDSLSGSFASFVYISIFYLSGIILLFDCTSVELATKHRTAQCTCYNVYVTNKTCDTQRLGTRKPLFYSVKMGVPETTEKGQYGRPDTLPSSPVTKLSPTY